MVLKTDKVMIVGDFNVHVDLENDSLGTTFLSDKNHMASVSVYKNQHTFNHTLDLVLINGNGIDHLKISVQNLLLSDHYLITFELLLNN